MLWIHFDNGQPASVAQIKKDPKDIMWMPQAVKAPDVRKPWSQSCPRRIAASVVHIMSIKYASNEVDYNHLSQLSLVQY